MCLAIPGKVIEIDRTSKPLTGKVDFGGIKKLVCLEYIPDVRIGEYVITHVGFAISKMNEEEAKKTLDLFDELEESSKEE